MVSKRMRLVVKKLYFFTKVCYNMCIFEKEGDFMKNQIYPVAYTIMPIKKTKELNEPMKDLDEKRELISYIPSKCYVVSSERKITKSGKVACSYGVVYPYITGRSLAENYYMANYPKYNSDGDCVNSSKTDFLTDSYESALEQAIIYNKELLDSTNYSKWAKEYHVTSKEKHEQLIRQYLNAATWLEGMTSDMNVNITEYEKITNKEQILKK